MAPLRETELYHPVAAYLEADGWRVDAEVKDCDICARKGEDLLIVELKTGLNFSLLAQAVERQRITDLVYIAVPAKCLGRLGRARTNALRVLRRLELGVLAVTLPQGIQVIQHPEPFDVERSRSRAKHRKSAILGELAGRSYNRNVGGSNKVKLHTAYREAATSIAQLLSIHGPQSAKALKTLGSKSPKTYAILYDNHYDWFVREAKGLYGLSEKGRLELATLYPSATRAEVEQLAAECASQE